MKKYLHHLLLFCKLMDSGAYEPEYEDAGDYETIHTYETEIREIENENI